MRPIKLTMTAFGPYLEKTVIDFDKLGKSGLYLITGNTGAGKTTIFDALSYALYGEPSGDNRKTNMLRSGNADPSATTEVSLVFEYRGERYTVNRSQRQGKRDIKKDAELIDSQGRIYIKKELDAKLVQIMGIDRNQFSQVAMIAQGDFMRLLTADTQKRGEILGGIFKTDRFSKIQSLLKENAAQAKSELEDMEKRIIRLKSSVRCSPESSVLIDKAAGTEEYCKVTEKVIDEDRRMSKTLEEKRLELGRELEQVNIELGKAAERQKTALELDIKRKELLAVIPALADAADKLNAAEKLLPEADKLNSSAAVIRKDLSLYKEMDSISRQKGEYKKSIEEKKSAEQQCSEELDMLSSQLEKDEGEIALLENADADLERLSGRLDSLQKEKAAVQKLRTDLADYICDAKKANAACAGYNRRKAEHDKAAESYNSLYRAYHDNMAGVLAGELRQGEPCPVCGSTEHPCAAVIIGDAPDKQQLEQAKKHMDITGTEMEKAAANAGQLKGIALGEKEMLGREASEVLGTDICWENGFGNALDAAAAEKISQLVAAIKETTELIRKAKEDNNRRTALSKRLPEIKEQLEGKRKQIGIIDSEIAELTANYRNKDARLSELKGSLEYPDSASAERAAQQLCERAENIRREHSAADNARKAAALKEAELKSAVSALEGKMAAGETPDGEKLARRKESIDSDMSRLLEMKTTVDSRIITNGEILAELKTIVEGLDAAQRRYDMVTNLSNTASGRLSGTEKTDLRTYVLTFYFDKILEHANIRLMKMTDGQYELIRKEKADNKQTGSALDINVCDHYSETIRDVKTLSGGEAFKASLCLALGMSDEIQSSAPGVHLDTMFVDEGFGNLDEESLSAALDVLATLGGTRLVGIISHVAYLSEKIDRQIQVTKDRTRGSSIQIISG